MACRSPLRLKPPLFNAKQDDLSVSQLAVCNGDVFPASSYSTTSATNNARASALGDYTTTSTLTGQLALKATLASPHLTGSVGIGDGTKRMLNPGDILRVEDLTGQGHTTRSVGNRISASVPLAG